MPTPPASSIYERITRPIRAHHPDAQQSACTPTCESTRERRPEWWREIQARSRERRGRGAGGGQAEQEDRGHNVTHIGSVGLLCEQARSLERGVGPEARHDSCVSPYHERLPRASVCQRALTCSAPPQTDRDRHRHGARARELGPRHCVAEVSQEVADGAAHTRARTHTRTCMHMHAHAHMHTCTHAHMHMHMHTCTHTHTHTHIPCTCQYTHAHMHACTPAQHMHMHTSASTSTSTCRCRCKCRCRCRWRCTHTQTLSLALSHALALSDTRARTHSSWCEPCTCRRRTREH